MPSQAYQHALDQLPAQHRDDLVRYIDEGVVPEHNAGLLALLAGDWRSVVLHADSALPEVVSVLRDFAPQACWGSAQRVARWEDRGGRNGRLRLVLMEARP